MKGAIEILTTAPEYDIVVVVVGSSARFYPHLAVQPIIDSAGSDKPIAVFLVPEAPQARAALGAAGVANFYTPEACADAVAAALARRAPRVVPVLPGAAGGTPASFSGQERAGGTPALPGGPGKTLDELEAYALFGRFGIPHAPSVALDIDIAAPPVLPFGYPVVLKVLSSEITHKSDVGGVRLGITDGASLVAATAAMRKRLPEARRVLVQPMMAGVGEVLAGYRVDPDVGPLVMVAAGGIYTEIYRDRSLRLAPVDPATAAEMIAEVQGLRALAGYRGQPPGDLAALAEAVAALSQLAAEPDVTEAEINPLIVREPGHGVVAVDAVVRLR
jgi:acyl-CoA synthetase (NDP forming)